jgi:hypothetical protein
MVLIDLSCAEYRGHKSGHELDLDYTHARHLHCIMAPHSGAMMFHQGRQISDM